jgi:hypothetical protein
MYNNDEDKISKTPLLQRPRQAENLDKEFINISPRSLIFDM